MKQEQAIFLQGDAQAIIQSCEGRQMLLRSLPPELAVELAQASLLRPLLRHRLQALVLETFGRIHPLQPPAVDLADGASGGGSEAGGGTSAGAEEAGGARASGEEGSGEMDPARVLALEWFGPQLDRRYLERREALERVSFRLLRTPSKGVALEAQQRLQGAEEDWLTISERWGMEPEARFGGRMGPMAPAKLGPQLAGALRRLEPGELSEPLRLGKLFALVQLEAWNTVELDDGLRLRLALELWMEWLDGRVEELAAGIVPVPVAMEG